MKWLLNTLAALAEITDCASVLEQSQFRPMALRPVTGTLGPKQLAWCDANLHKFKQFREQAEAAWSEPRLAIQTPSGQLMSDYAGYVGNEPTVNEIMSVVRRNVASSTGNS